jgi:hypothetical protein
LNAEKIADKLVDLVRPFSSVMLGVIIGAGYEMDRNLVIVIYATGAILILLTVFAFGIYKVFK